MANLNLDGYTTLKAIVANIRNEEGDFTARYYNRLMQLAIRVYKDLKVTTIKTYDKKWLTVTDINTVNLPSDFVKLIGIGVPYNGEMWTLTKNNGLIPPLSESSGIEAIDSDRGENQTIDGGDHPYMAYAAPPGQNKYYYKMDTESDRIILNGDVGSEVLLAYISTGVSLSQDTLIPKIAEEAIIAGIFWYRIRRDRDATQFDKVNYKKIFNDEFEKLKFAQAPTIDDMYDAIISTMFQGIKR